MFTIKAEEARKLTHDSLRGSIIEPLLEIAYSRIRKFAKKGEYSVPHPFHGAAPYPSRAAQEAAVNRLREEGYTVTYIDNPEPERPGTNSYWEVSW